MSLDPPLSRPGARRRRARAISLRRPAARRRRRTRAISLRRPRLRLLVFLALLALLLGGGWLWLRDSSLVRITDVRVTGATLSAEPRIRAALESTARGMTTMHVRNDELQRAVAEFPSVAALRVQTDFPHGLSFEIVQRTPVAVLTAGGRRMAATGGGLLLSDVEPPSGLPTIAVDQTPTAGRVDDDRTRAALAVAAAAPAPLRAKTARIVRGPHGIEAELEGGPPLIFGNQSDAAAKWAGAARVLADPSSAGATYLDLRVPGRVAAGGLGPVSEEDAQGDTNEAVPSTTGTTAETPPATSPTDTQP